MTEPRIAAGRVFELFTPLAEWPRVCRDCGRAASWYSYRPGKRGKHVAERWHCDTHVPGDAAPVPSGKQEGEA